jgi:hypothetical protein
MCVALECHACGAVGCSIRKVRGSTLVPLQAKQRSTTERSPNHTMASTLPDFIALFETLDEPKSALVDHNAVRQRIVDDWKAKKPKESFLRALFQISNFEIIEGLPPGKLCWYKLVVAEQYLWTSDPNNCKIGFRPSIESAGRVADEILEERSQLTNSQIALTLRLKATAMAALGQENSPLLQEAHELSQAQSLFITKVPRIDDMGRVDIIVYGPDPAGKQARRMLVEKFSSENVDGGPRWTITLEDYASSYLDLTQNVSPSVVDDQIDPPAR